MGAARDGTQDLLGQQRALDAVRMAIGIDAPGYNVFVSRVRTRRERAFLAEKAEELSIKQDLLDLAVVCEDVANDIEDRIPGG